MGTRASVYLVTRQAAQLSRANESLAQYLSVVKDHLQVIDLSNQLILGCSFKTGQLSMSNRILIAVCK